jgi:hypothetical protein
MQTPVMMQKASYTFVNCEASGKVVGDNVFECESGVTVSYFIERPELQDSKYLMVFVDTHKKPPEFTGNYDRGPRQFLAHEEVYLSQEPGPLVGLK